MELEFTTDQDELRDSIRAVLAKESPVALARAGRRDRRAPDRALDDDGRARLARAHGSRRATAASGSA